MLAVAPAVPFVLVLQERLDREMKSAAERKAAAAKLGAAVEGAKAAVWGTVGGVSVLRLQETTLLLPRSLWTS